MNMFNFYDSDSCNYVKFASIYMQYFLSTVLENNTYTEMFLRCNYH